MALYSYSDTYNEPFYGGGITSASVPSLFPIAINGRPYQLDLRQYRRRTIEALRQAQDNEALPAEQSLSTQGFWPRLQDDWSAGAGEIHFDDRDRSTSTRRRFFESEGIDVWTKKQISLLNTSRQVRSSANIVKILATESYVYVADGSTLLRTGDPEASSPSWTTITGTSGTILDLTTDGTAVYTAGSGGVYRSAMSGTTAVIFSTGAEATNARSKIRVVNGRLFAGRSNIFEELSSSGASTVITTHNDSAFRWTAIGGSQRALYAGGYSGTTTAFLRYTVNAGTGAIEQGGPAAPFPTGERVQVILGYVGLVVIGTNKGIRVATVAADGSLDYGKVIAVGSVNALAADGDYVWFTWFDTVGGTGRLSLAEFTDDGVTVPAYAKDVVTTVTADCLDVIRFEDLTYMVLSGSGVWAEYAELVSSGSLTTGWIDYGSWFAKTLIDLDMRHATLAGTIAVTIINANDDEVDYGASNQAGTDRPTSPLQLNHARLERFKLKLTFTRLDADEGPTLYSWVLRATPNPPRSEEILLPIIFSEVVRVGASPGQDYRYVLLEEMAHIRLLAEDGQIITYQEGERAEQAKISNWELQGYKETGDGYGTPWHIEGLMLVTLQTV
jgi:hypothetical protein